MPDTKIGVATPERVSVELPIAGLGYRVLAYLVDVGVLFTVSMVLYFSLSFFGKSAVEVYEDASQSLRVGALVFGFAVIWIYWTAMEVAWSGQTLGKRLLRIRVVRADGSPVTAFESAVRNLVRLVDFLPACYPVGLVAMLVDSKHRRLGDLVAGTLLVREEAIALSKYDAASPTAAAVLDTRQVELVTGYLARFDALDDAARVTLGRQLAVALGLPKAEADVLDAGAAKAWLTRALKGA